MGPAACLKRANIGSGRYLFDPLVSTGQQCRGHSARYGSML